MGAVILRTPPFFPQQTHLQDAPHSGSPLPLSTLLGYSATTAELS
jgi:hypothetical protein